MDKRIRRLRKEEYSFIVDFFERTYKKNYTLSNKAHFDWLFDNHLNDSDSEYTAVIALNKAGSIIGFYAWVPVSFYYFGKLIRCNYQMNMMIEEKYRMLGYGYLLLKEVESNGSDLGVTLNVGMNGRRLIEPAGWKISDLDRFIFVINEKKTSELIDNPAVQVEAGSFPLIPGTGSLNFCKIAHADDRLTKLSKKLCGKYPITLNRDAAYVQWRWFEHPLLTYMVYVVSLEDELVAYIVLRVEEYRQYKIGRLLDFISTDDAECFALANLLRECKALNIDFVDYFMLGAIHSESLALSGFILAEGNGYHNIPMVFNPPDLRPSVNFTYKVFNQNVFDERVDDVSNWHINKADADGDRAN